MKSVDLLELAIKDINDLLVEKDMNVELKLSTINDNSADVIVQGETRHIEIVGDINFNSTLNDAVDKYKLKVITHGAVATSDISLRLVFPKLIINNEKTEIKSERRIYLSIIEFNEEDDYYLVRNDDGKEVKINADKYSIEESFLGFEVKDVSDELLELIK